MQRYKNIFSKNQLHTNKKRYICIETTTYMNAKIFRLVSLLAIPILYLVFRPYFAQWAEDWEWATLLAGIFLLALEVMIIPGFGIAGISAFVCIYAGLVLIMLNNKGTDFSTVSNAELTQALLVGGILLGVVLVALFALIPTILRSSSFQHITNSSSLDKNAGYVSSKDQPKMVGKTGIAETILRPSGKIMIENQLFDATTQGDFINKGENITVIGSDGSALRVKKG